MKTLLLQSWKQMPLWVKVFTSRMLRPKYMVAVVAVILDDDNKILLGKHTYRKNHPWDLLAGSLEYGEDPNKAIVRELLEETDCDIEVIKLLNAVSVKDDHQISLIYLCRIVSGNFKPSPEISHVEFFSRHDLPDLLRTEKTLIEQITKSITLEKIPY